MTSSAGRRRGLFVAVILFALTVSTALAIAGPSGRDPVTSLFEILGQPPPVGLEDTMDVVGADPGAGPAHIVRSGAIALEITGPGVDSFPAESGCIESGERLVCGPGGPPPPQVIAFYIELAEPPTQPGLEFGVIRINADIDGNPSNNQTEGPFAGSDRAWELGFTPINGWLPQGFDTSAGLDRIEPAWAVLDGPGGWLAIEMPIEGPDFPWSALAVLAVDGEESRDETPQQTGLMTIVLPTTTTTAATTTTAGLVEEPPASTTTSGSVAADTSPPTTAGSEPGDGGGSGSSVLLVGGLAFLILGGIALWWRSRGGTGPGGGQKEPNGKPAPCARLQAEVNDAKAGAAGAEGDSDEADEKADDAEQAAADARQRVADVDALQSPILDLDSVANLTLPDGMLIDEVDTTLYGNAKDALLGRYDYSERANNPKLEAELETLRSSDAYRERRRGYEEDVAAWKEQKEALPQLRREAEEKVNEAERKRRDADDAAAAAAAAQGRVTDLQPLLDECRRLAGEGTGILMVGEVCHPEGNAEEVLVEEFHEVIPADVLVDVDVKGSDVVDAGRLSARFDMADQILGEAFSFMKRTRGLRTVLSRRQWSVGTIPETVPGEVIVHELRREGGDPGNDLVGMIGDELADEGDVLREIIPIEIPTSVPQAVIKVPQLFAKFGSLAARIGGKWAEKSGWSEVKIFVVELDVHVRGYERRRCVDGRVVCEQRWCVTDYGSIDTREIDQYRGRNLDRDGAIAHIDKYQTALETQIRDKWRIVKDLHEKYAECPD